MSADVGRSSNFPTSVISCRKFTNLSLFCRITGRQCSAKGEGVTSREARKAVVDDHADAPLSV